MRIKLLLFYLLFFPSLSMGYGTYYGVATHQNKRPYQEDRFAVAPHNKAGSFLGIYDGHGGDKTASFLQKQLHTYFAENVVSAKNSCAALKKSFLSAESYALKNYTDGATALAVYLDNKNKLYCAWVGDTRLVLEKNGAIDFATTDHKPDTKKELARITAAGGKVEKWGVYRVGGLAISRSIGDVDIKKNYAGQVIAIPDCKQVPLNNNNHFLIMASDGLWDVMSNKEAIKMVQKRLAHKKTHFAGGSADIVHSKDLNNIARYVQNKAIERGSEDNITVCIVCFDWSTEPLSIIEKMWNWLRGVK